MSGVLPLTIRKPHTLKPREAYGLVGLVAGLESHQPKCYSGRSGEGPIGNPSDTGKAGMSSLNPIVCFVCQATLILVFKAIPTYSDTQDAKPATHLFVPGNKIRYSSVYQKYTEGMRQNVLKAFGYAQRCNIMAHPSVRSHPSVSCEGVLLHSSGVLLPLGGCLWDASVALPSGGNH